MMKNYFIKEINIKRDKHKKREKIMVNPIKSNKNIPQ
jgi:hypothetical protein